MHRSERALHRNNETVDFACKKTIWVLKKSLGLMRDRRISRPWAVSGLRIRGTILGLFRNILRKTTLLHIIAKSFAALYAASCAASFATSNATSNATTNATSNADSCTTT